MTERDKWGRIPATLIEIDQPLCSLNWSERPCRAGPESNMLPYSRIPGQEPFWDALGVRIGTGAFEGARTSTPSNPIDSVFFDLGQFNRASVATDSYDQIPVTTGQAELYVAIEYRFTGRDDILHITPRLVYEGGQTLPASVEVSTASQSVIDSHPRTGNITFTDMGNLWYRVDFALDLTGLTDAAVAVALEFRAQAFESGAGDELQVAQPQISVGTLTDFAETDAEIKTPDEQPCFNTLPSCQDPDNYTVRGSTDGLQLRGNDFMTYPLTLSGARSEGLFLEFYVCAKALSWPPESEARDIISLGGALTVRAYQVSGENPQLEFVAPGGSISRYLDAGEGATYKIAAYLSRAGTLAVRGAGQTGVDPISPWPVSDVTFEPIPSAFFARVSLSDVKAYDYQPMPLNTTPPVAELARKGDRYGDAIFYARFNRATGYATDSGLMPDTEGGAIEFDAMLDDAAGGVRLAGASGATELVEPPLTLRFTERNKSSRLPETLNAIPSLIRASNKPAKLSVGGTNNDISALGSRDELNAEFEDHPYSDILTDPYRDQRTYDPESQGTFWGKWFARNVYKEGFPIRYVSGYETEAGAFERTNEYNYIIEKGSGPDARGRAVIKGFDILQSLRADKAVYPEPSSGRLSADISDTATSITLQPVGVGSEYPSGSFRVRVGGEGMDVTRSGDTLTINTRGLYGGLDSHSEDDTVQVVARIQSEQVHDIANTIITSAVPELAQNIPKDRWDGLASEYLPRLYSADITEPTGVEDLLAELTQTAPIYFYADVRTNLIELGVIREPTSVAVELGPDDALLAGKMDIKEYPKERIDEVWVYYRIRDSAEDVDDPNNYSQRFILVNPEEQQRRGRRSIKRIYTRWIVAGARDTAEEIAQAYISRFQNQPVRVSFDVDARRGDIWLGDVVKLLAPQKQTVTGETRSDINYQVIEAQESNAGHQFSYMAQSYEFFAPVSPDELTITIQPEDTVDGTGAVDQIDLRELYDSVVATEIDDITFIVAGGPGQTGGAIVGGGSGQAWSMNIPNDWPWSPAISLRVEPGAVVAGRGGDGGDGADLDTSSNTQTPAGTGGDGQVGLRTRYAVSLDNSGIIAGGGGGGGGSACNQNSTISGGGGGGGAGRINGDLGARGTGSIFENLNDYTQAGEGTLTSGGTGGYTIYNNDGNELFRGGKGGNLGQAGQPGETVFGGDPPGADGGAGGSPGPAIDGVSNITFINRGDIRGTEIN